MNAGARCPRCRRTVPGGAAFCPGCGAAQAGTGEVLIELGDDLPSGPVSEVTFASPGGRGRWIGAGVLAALVAAVGASVASGGGSERAATTTTRPATTVARTTVATTRAPTTAPSPTTSTTLRVVGAGDAPLLGEPTGLRLLMATYEGVHELDLDTGLIVDVDQGAMGETSAEDLQTVRGGFLKWVQGAVYAVPIGGDATQVEDAVNGQLLGADASGAAWLMVYPTSADQPTPRLVRLADIDAEPEPVTVPWMPDTWLNARPDGLGGLLVNVAGGVFRWADATADPVAVAPGNLLDAAGRFVLTRSCFPSPACELTVTDLGDGSARTLADPGPGATEGARISPDGRWVLTDVVVQPSYGPTEPEARVMRAWNLDGGGFVELPLRPDSPVTYGGWSRSVLVFSPDGSWLAYAASSDIVRVWRVGSSAPLDLEIPELQLNGPLSFAVSPAP